jgi:hypothetical protein
MSRRLWTSSPIRIRLRATLVRSRSRRSVVARPGFPQIDRLVAAYREIGVRTAEVLELHLIELTSLVAQVSVHWGLADGEGRSIYDFDASYTVADRGDGMRITAIAHNEMPRLRAAVERERPS